MSLYANTNMNTSFLRRISLSLADSKPSSAGRKCHSPSPIPLRKQVPRGCSEAEKFASLTNIGIASPLRRAHGLSDHAAPDISRGRSISLFVSRGAARNFPTSSESTLPYNADNLRALTCSLSFRGTHDISFMTVMPEITSPTSSLSYSALDTLLKGKVTSNASAPFTPYSKDETSRVAEVPHSYPLVMTNPNTNRHSIKSLTNPAGPKGVDQTTIEKPRFPSISPCPSIDSSSSSSSSDSDSSSSSPTARWRRSPSSESRPTMVTQSTLSTHTLSVMLPRAIQSEMVTVSVKKGDRLNIVADAWHMENDCHYEWLVHFAPGDADMPSVRARFAPDGKLTITVQRRVPGQTYGRGPMGTRF